MDSEEAEGTDIFLKVQVAWIAAVSIQVNLTIPPCKGELPYELRIFRNVLNCAFTQKRNVRYSFAWQYGTHVWLTPVSFTVQGVVHFWESLYPNKLCKVYPLETWKQWHMNELLVELKEVYITLVDKGQVNRCIQTDLGECCALSHLDFCALLDEQPLALSSEPSPTPSATSNPHSTVEPALQA
jgi:hypothetical protein